MPTIIKRKGKDGSVSWLAQVRVKPYSPVAQTFTKKAQATDWATKLEAELREGRDRGGTRHDATKLTVRQLAGEYLDDPETRALRTWKTTADRLAWWSDNYGHVRALQMNVLKLREARDKLRPGRKPATVNRYLSTLRSAWNWGRAAGLIPQDLLWPSRLMLPEPKGRTRYLADDELRRVLEEARAESPQMYAAVVVSLATGVRQSELLRLTWADVDLDKQRIRIMRSKNKESRAGYLPAVAVEALRQLRRGKVIGSAIFLHTDGKPLSKANLQWPWRNIVKRAGLRDFRWHDLRHTCASFLAQNGATLLEIGGVLGHKSPSVTMRYAHLVEGAPVTGHTELDSKLRGAT